MMHHWAIRTIGGREAATHAVKLISDAQWKHSSVEYEIVFRIRRYSMFPRRVSVSCWRKIFKEVECGQCCVSSCRRSSRVMQWKID